MEIFMAYDDPVISEPLRPLDATAFQAATQRTLDLAYVGIAADAKRITFEGQAIFDEELHPKKPQFINGRGSGSSMGSGFQVADARVEIPGLSKMSLMDFTPILPDEGQTMTPYDSNQPSMVACANQDPGGSALVLGGDSDGGSFFS